MAARILQQALREIERHVYGQREAVEDVLISMLSNGHVLLEGVPGIAKTRLAKTIAHVFGLSFQRVQFTPDVMPSDITGTHILREEKGRMHYDFQKGPVFTQLLLADEINRAPPKTQSALLEAMEERQVTLLGTTYQLPEPFIVIATQNPIEQEGTYPLPEAQQDRFLFKTIMTYPTREAEEQLGSQPIPPGGVKRVLTPNALLKLQELTRKIPLRTELVKKIVSLVRATREHPSIAYGASPRAIISLSLSARAAALLHGRHYATLEDIRRVILPVLRHRIILTYEAERTTTREAIITDLAKKHLH